MCSRLLVLGGIHMQQSSMCLFHPYYVPHFPVHSKAIQYFLTLLSTPRGPPARKSSSLIYIITKMTAGGVFTPPIIRFINIFRENKKLLLCFKGSGSVPKTFFINVPIHGCVRFWFRNNFRDGTFLLPVCNLLQAGQKYNWSYFATSWHTVHDTLRTYA